MLTIPRPVMRGRDHERRVLDDLLRVVRGGGSETLIIRGEPGIGKTTLLRYVAERAAPDFRLAQISGVESEMELAYAGLHQLCLPMFDAFDGLPEPQRAALGTAFGLVNGEAPDRLLVGSATLSLLSQAAQNQPLACVIDDVQWLDDASGQVLAFVARRLGAESIAMVFAIRDEAVDSPFADLPDLAISGVSVDDARALLALALPGRVDDRVRDRIIAETGGNPLALLELPLGMSSAELAGGFGLPSHGRVPAKLEEHYLRRFQRLPRATQRLMLVAAADSVGDAATVWRAAHSLGIGCDAAAPATRERLLEIGHRVVFRHPLIRSAVYNSASEAARRAAHTALAQATDPAADPERRAWHRAQAAVEPDVEIAAELEHCASRSQARGGVAAAAALLERSAELTPEAGTRVERRLAAAHSHVQAGAYSAASRLLSVAEAEAADELTHARIALLRGLVASASSFGGEAPLQLLKAAGRLEPLDIDLSRQTYLDAWGAALFAGHLASPGGDLLQVSSKAQAAPRQARPTCPFDELLDGLARLITEDRAAAAPVLRRALDRLTAGEVSADRWLRWGVLASSAAVSLWDFETWSTMSTRQVDLAHQSGALAMLSIALNGQAMIACWAGDLDAAAALVAEDAAINQATDTHIAPYGAMLLAAYQGRLHEASRLITATIEDSVARGEGLGVDLARWTASILNNSLGRYAEALTMASPADDQAPGLYISTWMLSERVEAGVRSGRRAVAAAALNEFENSANPGNSPWGLGLQARARAMLCDGDETERLYREAIEVLGESRVRTELARSHLVFGEWLRRENRRVAAREQLRLAHDMFVAMSAEGFAERARRELLATGERVNARQLHVPTDLTPQEEHIARRARDGQTNAEIAAELYLSARTVEWHLRKIFTKLDISSRRALREALPDPAGR